MSLLITSLIWTCYQGTLSEGIRLLHLTSSLCYPILQSIKNFTRHKSSLTDKVIIWRSVVCNLSRTLVFPGAKLDIRCAWQKAYRNILMFSTWIFAEANVINILVLFTISALSASVLGTCTIGLYLPLDGATSLKYKFLCVLKPNKIIL